MKIIEFAFVVAAAAGVAIWRGVAVYRYGFHKKDL